MELQNIMRSHSHLELKEQIKMNYTTSLQNILIVRKMSWY
jgi:hypothetical protein